MKAPGSATKRLLLTALMAAFCCLVTLSVRIPLPGGSGYLHPGDGVVLLCGILLGPVSGAAAAGIGSALSDLLSGYPVYLPATALIKGGMAVLTGVWMHRSGRTGTHRLLAVGALAEGWMLLSYFAFEAWILRYGAAAAAALPGNLLQAVIGLALAGVLLPMLKKTPVRKLFPKAPKQPLDGEEGRST